MLDKLKYKAYNSIIIKQRKGWTRYENVRNKRSNEEDTKGFLH